MTVLLKLWKLGLGLLVGLAIGWFVMVPPAREAGRSAGYEAGKVAGISEERILHEEQRRKAEAKADEDRRSAQAEIATVERDYHQREQARRNDLNGLEQALAAERADNATPIPTPSPGAPCSCRPAISRSVSDRLRAIGHGGAAPGSTAAGAQAPVR
ncbi:hypothetical protein [Aureimonas psammosilenae]|uniref:hypothetical protein n=1 Tax=Aureimonas psammosilenae TaxID=2495496 RepID=UPI0012608C74|nr:hypothetical protein [Aureimonas psammosilenae]